jgi:preprotein translocase subunit SecY
VVSEKITDKGIGNGISLLIMVGILARFPQAFIQEFTTRRTTTVVQCYWLSKLFILLLLHVLLTMAIRKTSTQLVVLLQVILNRI